MCCREGRAHLLSSVREMDCLREETVPVSGRSGAQSSVASTRRDGNSSKMECAWGEGSRVILPALLLTLDKYRVSCTVHYSCNVTNAL